MTGRLTTLLQCLAAASKAVVAFAVSSLLLPTACVKPFAPPPVTAENRYLVVDGIIALGANTRIALSKTRNLSDTAQRSVELNARVLVESEDGLSMDLTGDSAGIYTSAQLLNDAGTRYRLRIITENGKEYVSEYVEAKQTPAIESLEWDQDDDIYIYLNTSDPENDTRYYRWEYVETWEYHTPFDSYLDFRNGEVVFLEPSEYRSICYNSHQSNDILLGTTAALSQDVISRAPITRIPNDNSKISDRYSILVRQYGLTREAHEYWQILKQNSQQTGGIFDPQPSQLTGNIRCINNPGEPVIGYISACSVAEKRLFILWSQLEDRKPSSNSILCKEQLVSRDSAAFFLRDGTKLPAYLITDGPIAVAPSVCVDCRQSGGVTAKPSFW